MSQRTVAVGLAILLILAAAYGLYDRGRQAERADTAERVLSDSTETYKARERHLRGLLRADSAADRARLAARDTFTRVETRYRTLRDTIEVRDTVLVSAADEAIQACTIALGGCELALASGDSVQQALEAQVRNLEAQVRTTRALAEARCDGTVPTWTLPVTGLLGAAAGAWIRGE